MASSIIQTNDLGSLASGSHNVNLIDANFQQLITAVNTLKTFSNYYVDLGAANALAITVPTPQIVTLIAGLPLQIKVAADNTGPATLNVTSNVTPLGPLAIVNTDGTPVYYHQMRAGGVYSFMGDGTNFQLLNPSTANTIDYVPFTAPVTISATTEATATTIVTSDSVIFNGSTLVFVEFFSPGVIPANADTINLYLFDGAASIGLIGSVFSTDSVTTPVFLKRTLTPSNAAHTYSIRGSRVSSNGVVGAGAGGVGASMPGFIRISKW